MTRADKIKRVLENMDAAIELLDTAALFAPDTDLDPARMCDPKARVRAVLRAAKLQRKMIEVSL